MDPYKPLTSGKRNTRTGCSCLKPKRCLKKQSIPGVVTTIYCGSAVEPTIAVHPKNRNHVVVAWQQSRISNGAALNIGIRYTKNGGRTWHFSSAHLQICDPCKRGVSQRLGDSWLSFSSDGKSLYLSNVFLNATREPKSKGIQSGMVLNVSPDGGETWSRPHILASSMNYISEPTNQFANLDKPSNTSDPCNPKRAICCWSSFNPTSSSHGDAFASQTWDKGKTWSSPCLIYDPFPDLAFHKLGNWLRNNASSQNNVVVISPLGWLMFTTRYYARPSATNEQYASDTFPFRYTVNDLAVVRSENGGLSWSPFATPVTPSFVNQWVYTGGYTYDSRGNITGGVGTRMRNDATIPFYTVNRRNGYLYVVNISGQFRADHLPQIALYTSYDNGKTWSAPMQVNRTPQRCRNPQAFAPAVAVTDDGQVGVFYVDFRNDDKSNLAKTKTDAWFAVYQQTRRTWTRMYGERTTTSDKGNQKTEQPGTLRFVKEIRLSKSSYIAQNGPNTTQGNMVNGDYQFVVSAGRRFHAIHTQSTQGYYPPARKVVPGVLVEGRVRSYPVVSTICNTEKSTARMSYWKESPNSHVSSSAL